MAHNRTHEYKVRVGRGAMVQFATTAIQVLAGLGLSVVVSRRLGFDDFGIYSLGLAAAYALSVVTRLGLDLSVVKSASLTTDDASKARTGATVWTALAVAGALGAVGGVVLWALSPLVGLISDDARLVPVLQAFALLIPLLNILHVSAGAMRAQHRALPSSILPMVIHPVSRLVLAGGLVMWDPRLDFAVLGTLAAAVLAAFAGLTFVLTTFPLRFAGRAPISDLIRFGAWQTGIASTYGGLQWADLALVTAYLPIEAAGVYRIGTQAAFVFSLVASGMALLFAPLARDLIRQGDRHHLDDVAKSLARISVVLTGTAGIVLLIAPEVLLAFFGPNVTAAFPTFRVLGGALLLSAAAGPFGHVLAMGGRIHLEFIATSSGLVVAVAGAVVLIPRVGLLGAALATAAGFLVRSTILLIAARRTFQVNPLSIQWLVGVIAISLFVWLGLTVPVPGLAAGPIAGGAFFVMGWRFVLTASDRSAIRSIIKGRPGQVGPSRASVEFEAS